MLLSVLEFIGRFHPVLVHLPIGILLLALLLQWISHKPAYAISPAVLKVVWWIGIISALLSCLTGYSLSLDGGYEEGLVNVHMWLGIAVAAVSLFTASKAFTGNVGWLYKTSALTLLILVVLTGHFGGSLTHGSDYLTEGLNAVKEVPVEPVVKPIPDVQEAQVYGDVIQPVLETKCYSCHGEKKQKGKLRLDSPSSILKGGKEGKIVVAGDPKHSDLLKSLLLPKEEDGHMPPKQKSQLKESQIHLISWWIEQGCPFDKKVKDLSQPDNIKTLLTALQKKPGEEKRVIPLQPQAPVEPGNEKAISQLKAKGVIVMPVAEGSNYLMVNCISAPEFSDSDVKLLTQLKKQVVNLKAGNTRITDAGLAELAKLENLISLQLNHTAITDKGLVNLKSLANLESLNLVSTAVTVRGVAALQQLKKLQQIYVYKTQSPAHDYGQLKSSFPLAHIDTGGYSLPSLPSDTEYLTKPRTIVP